MYCHEVQENSYDWDVALDQHLLWPTRVDKRQFLVNASLNSLSYHFQTFDEQPVTKDDAMHRAEPLEKMGGAYMTRSRHVINDGESPVRGPPPA